MDPFLLAAIEEAEAGLAEGGIPIGSVIVLYRIPRVVIGENKSFLGEEAWLTSHGVSLEVVQDSRCLALMRDFMAAKPGLWAEDIGE